MNNRNKIKQLINKRQAAENTAKDGSGKKRDSSASGDEDEGQDKSSETQKQPSQLPSPIMCYLIFCVVVIIYIVWSSIETYTGALYYDMD